MGEKWRCLECGYRFESEEIEDYDTEFHGEFPHVREVALPHCPKCDSMNVEI